MQVLGKCLHLIFIVAPKRAICYVVRMNDKDINVWLVSDQHFNHTNILSFTNHDGNKVRPEFADVNEMNEIMIARHNQTVRPHDKVYFLGDVCFGNEAGFHSIMKRLNGKKRLILGNHDHFEMAVYRQYFQRIMVVWRPIREVIFSHYPLLLGADDPKIKANVHGHIHRGEIGGKHLNVSVEMIDYTPIHFDEVISRLRKRGLEL